MFTGRRKQATITQLSMNFIMLMNSKCKQLIVDILIFVSGTDFILNSVQQEKIKSVGILISISGINFMLS